MKRILGRSMAYLALAWAMVWPAGQLVPGGERTDVWHSLWAMWFSQRELSNGRLPWSTDLLNFPDGGTLLLPDPLAAVFSLVGVPVLGVAGAYTALVLLRLAMAGVIAHGFASDWLTQTGLSPDAACRAGWVAGIGYSTAPVLLAGVQCGTTEAMNAAWPALAAWMCWRAATRGGRANNIGAAGALALTAVASWYAAVVGFTFAATLLLLTPQTGTRSWRPRLGIFIGSLLLVLPFVALTHQVHGDPHHLGTRLPEVLASIRRSFGAADLAGWVWPIDEANIAIANPAERGEGYLHTTYLGAVLLLGSMVTLVRGVKGSRALGLAGVLCGLLAMGPVLLFNGEQVSGWMPYALLEPLPGFGGLSLLWRLGLGAALAASLLCAAATGGHRMAVGVIGGLVLLEVCVFSPAAGGVRTSSSVTPTALRTLEAAPPGAVLTVPAVRQHRDLWWQTIHGHPITGAINRQRGHAATKWLMDARDQSLNDLLTRAQTSGIRYLIVDRRATLRGNPNRRPVQQIALGLSPIAQDEQLTIYALW
jgi:hypothetical protein